MSEKLEKLRAMLEKEKLKRILNKTDTMLAQQKQQVIKDAFANWIWKDPHCSPKCAPAMCGFCSAALQKWEPGRTCNRGLWQCITWMLDGSQAT